MFRATCSAGFHTAVDQTAAIPRTREFPRDPGEKHTVTRKKVCSRQNCQPRVTFDAPKPDTRTAFNKDGEKHGQREILESRDIRQVPNKRRVEVQSQNRDLLIRDVCTCLALGASVRYCRAQNLGTAVGGVACCRGLSQSGRTDKCGQETMQKHTGLGLLESETAFGEDDAGAPLVLRSRRGPGAREFGAALSELTMDHYHHEVLRDDFQGLFLFGEQAGRGGTDAAHRTKANFP